MTAGHANPGRYAVPAARLILGAVFVYLGLTKALDPVGFLKLVRQFDLIHSPPILNFVAAVLPWLEIFCGALLLIGFKSKATALLALILLLGFTSVVALRAWSIHRHGGLPFCAIRFDCGCGMGEVLVCAKLVENAALAALSALILVAGGFTVPPHRQN